MSPFATAASLAPRLPDFDPEDAGELAEVELLLQQATDFLAAECGYTADAVAAETSDLVVYGTGTPYLFVGPHSPAVVGDDVAPPTGYTVPTFVDRGDYLVTVDAYGTLVPSYVWPLNVPFTVTAKYGAAVPGDLKSACIDLVCFWWAQSHAASGTQLDAASREIPPSVRAVIDRRRYSAAFAGALR